MRSILALVTALLISTASSAQVRSSLTLTPAADGKSAVAKLTVMIEPGWHIASLTQPDGGPVRTTISIPKNQAYRLAGDIKFPEPHKEHSAAFDIEVQTHEGSVDFLLPLEPNPEAKSADPSKLIVELTYQVCNDETCLLPKTDTIRSKPPRT
jgi:hypothetical protein